MSAFSVVPKATSRFLAVRVWPGNEDDLENIFGDRLVKSDTSFYEYAVVSAGGHEHTPVSRGDWLVLTPSNVVEVYSTKDFDQKFSIMESIFNLPDPTGKQES